MGLLAPLGLLAALLAAPILLLYMLRLRRRDLPVASTFLWAQVMRDREANAPWQRLRRSLLLLLQLLLLALLVLALARPFQIVPALGAGRIALLIDASASMNAADGPNGLTRFEQARAQAADLLASRRPDDAVTLIRVGSTPEVLTPYTTDSERLRVALQRAAPGQGAADWDAALTLAAAGGAGAGDFDVLLLSDGGGPLRPGAGQAGTSLPAIPGDLRYVPVGQGSENVGILALAVAAQPGATADQPAPGEAFALIANTGTLPAPVVIAVEADGALVEAVERTLAPGEEFAFVPSALPAGFRLVRVSVAPSSESTVPDLLPLDDVAWAAYDGAPRRVLLVSAGNRYLEQGLRSLPRLAPPTIIGLDDPVPVSAFDLTVFDGAVPDTVPASGGVIFINPPRGLPPLFSLGGLFPIPDDQLGVFQLQRGDPRLAYVDFADVTLLQVRQVTEAAWAEPLISAAGAPAVLAGLYQGRPIALLPFDLRDGDLPLTSQFPLLLNTLIDWIAPVAAPELPAEAVNLFNPEESAIAPSDSIIVGASIISPAAAAAEQGQLEWWPWLALAALAIALIEWAVYHRRNQSTGAPPARALRRKGLI